MLYEVITGFEARPVGFTLLLALLLCSICLGPFLLRGGSNRLRFFARRLCIQPRLNTLPDGGIVGAVVRDIDALFGGRAGRTVLVMNVAVIIRPPVYLVGSGSYNFV